MTLIRLSGPFTSTKALHRFNIVLRYQYFGAEQACPLSFPQSEIAMVYDEVMLELIVTA
jgi:hypothetical protein